MFSFRFEFGPERMLSRARDWLSVWQKTSWIITRSSSIYHTLCLRWVGWRCLKRYVQFIDPQGDKGKTESHEKIWTLHTRSSSPVNSLLKEIVWTSRSRELIYVWNFFASNFQTKRFPIHNFFHSADLVAVPDFAAGAMENWGLLTFRETYLLSDPASASAADKQDVAVVVSHELAHQWFGNLVTMKWWNDLWLNEGFANYVEYIGTDHFRKDWKVVSLDP